MEKISVLMGPQAHDGQGDTDTYAGTGSEGSVGPFTANFVDVTCTTNAFISFNGTAVANSDYFVVANTTYRFPIVSGSSISVIQATAAGSIYAHPVS